MSFHRSLPDARKVIADVMLRDTERGQAAGFTDCMTRPIDPVGFCSLLDRLLEEPREDVA